MGHTTDSIIDYCRRHFRPGMVVFSMPGPMPELLLLAKAPIPGLAKTRLAESIGQDAAAAVAAAFIDDTITTARDEGWKLRLVVTPAEAAPSFSQLAGGAPADIQVDGDLGDRIGAALRDSVARGQRPVLIGSDSPDLPRSIIGTAFILLQSNDVVLGPATDGGFYLIGCREFPIGLFEGVPWSTPAACEAVVRNARARGLSIAFLPEWEDVDDLESLIALKERINGTDRCPASQRAIARIGIATAGTHVV